MLRFYEPFVSISCRGACFTLAALPCALTLFPLNICSTFFKDYHVQLAETIKSLLTLESVPGASRVSTDGAEDPVEPQPAPSTSHASYPAADAAVTRDPVAPSTGEATLDGPEVTRASQSGEESAELERESDDLGTAGHGSEVTCRIGDVRTPVEQVGDESSRAYCMQHLATEIGKHKPSAPPKHIDSITADEPIALHFNPQRGGTLDKFVGVATRAGLRAELCESFDEELDRKVERLRGGSRAEWPGFTEEHCRPIMLILRP